MARKTVERSRKLSRTPVLSRRLLAPFALLLALALPGTAAAQSSLSPGAAQGLTQGFAKSPCGSASIRLPSSGALERTAARIAAGQPVGILAIGSSSTQGIGASSPSHAYPAQLQVELGRHFPASRIEVRNAGVGGETADRTLARLLAELDSFKPDLVVWQVGTNDALTAGTTEANFARELETGLDAIQAHGADVVVVDQQFYKTVKDPARYERFVRIVEKVAGQEHICLFPRYKIMQSWDVEGSGRLQTMLASDGFHMNDRGYGCVADLLARQISDSITNLQP